MSEEILGLVELTMRERFRYPAPNKLAIFAIVNPDYYGMWFALKVEYPFPMDSSLLSL